MGSTTAAKLTQIGVYAFRVTFNSNLEVPASSASAVSGIFECTVAKYDATNRPIFNNGLSNCVVAS